MSDLRRPLINLMDESSPFDETSSVNVNMTPTSLLSPAFSVDRRQRQESRLLGRMDLNYATQVGLNKEFLRTGSMSNITTPLTTRSRMSTYSYDNVEDEADIVQDLQEPFVKSEGLSNLQASMLLRVHGRNELPEKIVPKWYIFVSQLWQPMPIMIWLAAIIEGCILDWLDCGILLFIQFVNASIGYYEITKAGDAVAALKKSLKGKAYAKRDGAFIQIDAALLVPGDLVSLCSGAAIPADCRLNEGTIDVDQAALTGESLPVTMLEGDECRMGSTVARGETEGTVVATGCNTFFGKTATMLQATNESSNFNKMLMSIISVLVAISLSLSIATFIYLYFLPSTGAVEYQYILFWKVNINIVNALSFVVVLIVASIPMAVEIVTTTTLAVGSKQLAKEGAIVTRLAAIEDLAGMSILCSDKTGTLTLNKMVIQDETPIYLEAETQYSILRYAAMAARWKEPPKDALDTLILTAVDLPSLSSIEQTDFLPFDPIVKRTEGTVRDMKTGQTFKVTKGAPNVILKLVQARNPNPEIVEMVEEDVHSLGLRGIRSLAVAKTNSTGEWEMLGLLTFLDPPRPDTKQTIEDANKYGVSVKMITGDHLLIAKETARILGMGNFICSAEGLPVLDPETKAKPQNLALNFGDQCLAADGFAEVFPEHKYLIVECLREMGYKVGMTGDGVNDAPALKRADVGVAVSGATDAARAASDIFLTEPGLSTIVNGIVISRAIFAKIRNFLIYRIAASFQLLFFFVIAAFAFQPVHYMPSPKPEGFDTVDWPVFFHIPVFMLILITLLNDGTLISIGYDNVIASQVPEKWNRSVLFAISTILSIPPILSNLLVLHVLLDSWNANGIYQAYLPGPGVSYGSITTAMFLKVGISDILTIFSARTGSDWFFMDKPANLLLGCATISMIITTTVACVWPLSSPDGIETIGLALRGVPMMTVYIWVFCILCWIIQDIIKVIGYALMKKVNLFAINDTGKPEMPKSVLDYKKRHNTVAVGGSHGHNDTVFTATTA